MSKSAIPKSKAKTAYGLLSEIRKLILEEPKRYDQNGFLLTNYQGDDAPACGTVGCVAGWVQILKGNGDDSVWTGIDGAGEILGLDTNTQWALFNSFAAGRCGGTPAEREAHAKRGAAHIEAFQKKYATQLKAKRV